MGCCLALNAEAACTRQSGDRTAALVELYTSEGCSSCPPADRWLSGLGNRGYVPERVVPFSLHVDYWDYIGDPYAKREFSARQRKLTQLQRMALVYTPQVLLQGRDTRLWGTAAFDEAVAKINAQPAKARLRLDIVSLTREAVEVRAAAEVLDQAHRADAALYIGSYENRPAHDYLVLEWRGPFGLTGEHLMKMPLLPKAVPANSGVVGFVQNRRTAEVLQALMLAAC